METTLRSNKWKYRIDIKNLFEDETTPELITRLCTSLIQQLNKIRDRVEKSDLINSDYIGDELYFHIDNFEFLLKLSNGTITENTWHQYNFEGDFEEMFNDYLSNLYDLADSRVSNKKGISEKFIWIG